MQCTKCGTELIDGICPKCTQNETSSVNKMESKFKDFFMSPNEKLVTVLGNSYIENFFHNGSVARGFTVVSDKRVYFRGSSYYISYDQKGRKKVMKNSQSRTVDLKDVTGTGTDIYAQVGWKIFAVLFPILLILLMYGCAFATMTRSVSPSFYNMSRYEAPHVIEMSVEEERG